MVACREYFVVQELTLNPETGESSVWTVPRKDGERELHNIPDWGRGYIV